MGAWIWQRLWQWAFTGDVLERSQTHILNNRLSSLSYLEPTFSLAWNKLPPHLKPNSEPYSLPTSPSPLSEPLHPLLCLLNVYSIFKNRLTSLFHLEQNFLLLYLKPNFPMGGLSLMGIFILPSSTSQTPTQLPRQTSSPSRAWPLPPRVLRSTRSTWACCRKEGMKWKRQWAWRHWGQDNCRGGRERDGETVVSSVGNSGSLRNDIYLYPRHGSG